MASKLKGKGGKKHRRAKNVVVTDYVELPDQDQYFGFVTKILGSGRVTLNYFKEKLNDKTNKFEEWQQFTKIGVIRGKMMKRIYINLNDLVLVTERDFDSSKVDIIGKYEQHQIPLLKKKTNFPNISNLNGQGGDIEFDFDDPEPQNNPKKTQPSKDYMADIPTFSSDDDSVETL